MRHTKGNTIMPLIVNYLRNAKYDLALDRETEKLLVQVRDSRKRGGLDILLEKVRVKEPQELYPVAVYRPKEVTIYTPEGTFTLPCS